MFMKTARPLQLLRIYLLVMGAVGCAILSIPVVVECAIFGCSEADIFRRYAESFSVAWPALLICLLPTAIFLGAVFLSLHEGKNEK
jgi:hypothetical protein